MNPLTLYHMPGTCSQVVLTALEEIGCDYQERSVNLMAGAQYQPQFLSLNYKSKVPVLADGATIVTELPAILFRLATLFPGSGLLPRGADGSPHIAGLSDLIWAAGTVQPLVSRLFQPETVAQGCADQVRQVSLDLLANQARTITARVSGTWWYGNDWSIVDTFLVWIFRTATRLGFPLAEFGELEAYSARDELRDSFRRAIAIEHDITVRDGLQTPASLQNIPA